ncbi:MAG: glycosyltransferase family 4 protein [Acidimicrobiales bacterium]
MGRPAVGINLLWLVPGEVGGSEESTLASVRALGTAAPDLDLRLFVLEPLVAAHPDLAERFGVDVLRSSGRARWRRVVAESTWLRRRTRGLDLVHHAGGTAPLRRGGPYVLTVHDLQPLERRGTHGAVKRAWLRATIPPSVRHARCTVVPSEFVRRTVLDHIAVEPDRVVAIPHGVEPPGVATGLDELTDRYRLDGPVVLYPAITYPHKNHRVLVAAFARLVARHPGALLVLTGGEGSEEPALRAQVESLGLTDRVRRTGRISAADVAGLYQAAAVVAVPSRYEGFGLPAAEAMAHGAAVVAADTTALPEVVGDAGVLVGPDDVGGWATAIGSLLDDAGERARLGALGRARSVARHSWAANAAALADVYRSET